MFVAPSTSPHPARFSLMEHNLTIPDRPALIARRHSTLSPLHTSRPIRSSPLAGPSIAPEQDGTLNLGAFSAPPTPRGRTRHLSPLAEVSSVADSGVATEKHQRRRTLTAVFSKMSFPSSTSATSSSPSTSSSSSSSSTNSVPDQPAGNTRRRLRSLGSEDAPPVPPMPAWAHNTMPNRRSQNLSPSASASSSRSPAPPRPVSFSVPSSPHSSRENLPAASLRPRPRPQAHGARRSVIQGQGQGQGQMDAGKGTRLSVAGRLPPSTSRNPEENWLTQAAPPKFSRAGLRAQGVVMPVSARDARRMSTLSTASTASARAKSLELGGPPRPKPAHVAPGVSHGRVPRRPATAPSLQLAVPGAPSSSSSAAQLRSRTSSFASASSDGYVGDRSGCATPPLTMSSTTSASSVSVSFADPSASVAGVLGAGAGVDELGFGLGLGPPSGVQIQLNDVPVPPEAYCYDAKGKGKARAVAVDIRSVRSAGSISSMVSQGSWSAYSARSVRSGDGNAGEGLTFGTRHARAATTPAEAGAGAIEGEGQGNLKRRRSTIARVWKQVVRSVAHR